MSNRSSLPPRKRTVLRTKDAIFHDGILQGEPWVKASSVNALASVLSKEELEGLLQSVAAVSSEDEDCSEEDAARAMSALRMTSSRLRAVGYRTPEMPEDDDELESWLLAHEVMET